MSKLNTALLFRCYIWLTETIYSAGYITRQEIDDKWARRFVKERVVPPDRQNIGMIMRQLHMKKYSEFPILEYTSGRCCMDDFYLEEMMNDLIKER